MSPRIRVAVREELVGWTLATIADLFHAEGFVADHDCTPNVGGERRRYVEQFYAAVDWTDWDQVRRILRVVESVLDSLRRREIVDPAYAEAIADSRQQIERLLARDGYIIDELVRSEKPEDLEARLNAVVQAGLTIAAVVPGSAGSDAGMLILQRSYSIDGDDDL